jgi:hypothetical protein
MYGVVTCDCTDMAEHVQVFGLHALPDTLVTNFSCNASDANNAALSWQVWWP